jgi:hypothetical protein
LQQIGTINHRYLQHHHHHHAPHTTTSISPQSRVCVSPPLLQLPFRSISLRQWLSSLPSSPSLSPLREAIAFSYLLIPSPATAHRLHTDRSSHRPAATCPPPRSIMCDRQDDDIVVTLHCEKMAWQMRGMMTAIGLRSVCSCMAPEFFYLVYHALSKL